MAQPKGIQPIETGFRVPRALEVGPRPSALPAGRQRRAPPETSAQGAAAAVTEVMAGRLDYYLPPLVAALPLIRSGKVTALAVPSATRLALLPDVPTTEEAGVPNAVFQSGVGLWAQRKTPREIVNRLNQEVLRIANLREVRDALHASGAEPWPLTPEQFDAFIKSDSAQQQALVKAAGIKVD